MGRRHKGYRPPPVEHADLPAFFEASCLKIARGAAVLDAYRKGSGFYLHKIRTKEALASFAEAQERCRWSFNHIDGMQQAWEHSGRFAMSCYLGQWWQQELRDDPPFPMSEGDEFFSYETVRCIIENYATVEPDKRG
jgi:hypothetical protein